MGHHTGFIALESGIAGGAEEILVPEKPVDVDGLCRRLRGSFEHGKRSAIVIVAEGEHPGNSFELAQAVKDRLDIDSRVCILGHVQRGGTPTARDRVLAAKLGAAAIGALINGKSGCMVGEVNGRVAHTPLSDTWQKQKQPDAELQALATLLCE
jgi:6-phosphofructokinase 1